LGSPPIDGKQEVSPAGVRFFVNGGRLKVCIAQPKTWAALFTTLDDVSRPFEELERKLLANEFEWRADDERKDGYSSRNGGVPY